MIDTSDLSVQAPLDCLDEEELDRLGRAITDEIHVAVDANDQERIEELLHQKNRINKLKARL